MLIIPAIDLYNGKVVRLTEGDYQQQKVYDVVLAEMLDKYEEAGISFIHIVDLNGAKGDNSFEDLLQQAAAGRKARVQVGGGIRDMEKLQRLLDKGIDRVILGTAAVTIPAFTTEIAAKGLQQKVVIGIDVKDYTLMINGWRDAASTGLFEFMDRCVELGFRSFLCTDISKDGKLEGPSIALYKELTTKYPAINLIASGGVSGMHDIEALVNTGVSEVVVGKAIYENRISIEEVAAWNKKVQSS